MIRFETPLALFILVPLLFLWWRLARGPRSAWIIRGLLVVLCSLMVASPVLREGERGRRIVFVVDRSLSAGSKAAQRAEEMVRNARSEKASNDRLWTVGFGRGARVITASAAGELGGAPLEDASDLYAGLRLGTGLLGEGGGRLVVVSDGLHTGVDPRSFVPELRRAGARLDFSHIDQPRKQDVAIIRIDTPQRVVVGDPFQISFSVHSPIATKTTVRVEREGREIIRQMRLEPGQNRFAFRDSVSSPGLVAYSIAIPVDGDGEARNNRARAVTEAVGQPEVLLVNSQGQPGNLARALDAAGLRVRIAGPGRSMSSAAVKSFQAVVLEDVALSELGDRTDAALRHYVTKTGGGLLVTGGKNSFAAGGYYRSRLEPILPVSMERKDRYRRPPLAMGIVLDRSGSMAAPVEGGATKMDLANRAAAEAVELLAPQDRVAVYAVDSSAHEVLDLTPIEGNRAHVRDRILSVESRGGGIFVRNGLEAAVSELAGSEATTRHIILFADAADSEQKDGVEDLVGQWTDAGGTMSVIGLGSESDPDAGFLRRVAETGGGEAFLTSDPRALPRIFCQDAIRIARRTFIEEPTPARLAGGLHVVGELGIDEFPRVGGYNLCFRREDAELLVRTDDEHTAPLVAAWHRGVGRVVAVTCQADGPYSGGLAEWGEYKAFFGSLVKWLRRPREDVSLFGTIVREGRTANVILEMDRATARQCRGAKAVVIPPDEGPATDVPLHWISPRRMRGRFTLGSDGVYHGVALTRSGKKVALPPVVLPYSPEFERPATGRGREVLGELARATGGGRLLSAGQLFEDGVLRHDETGSRSLVPPLAVVALLLLLCDIMTRRSLWPVFVPGRVRAIPGRAGGTVKSWWGRAISTVRRDSRGQTPTSEVEEDLEEDRVAEGGEEDEEAEDSLFERAKRRSRR